MVARVIWDHEVGGSSPLTPTEARWRSLSGFGELFRDAPASAHDGPHDMAVRAHELAFLDLSQDRLAPPAADHGADLVKLQVARQVIPVHDVRREYLAAVLARRPSLQGIHPGALQENMRAFPREPRRLAALGVIPAVVNASAVAAIGELSRSRTVERGRWLRLPAHGAASNHLDGLVRA